MKIFEIICFEIYILFSFYINLFRSNIHYFEIILIFRSKISLKNFVGSNLNHFEIKIKFRNIFDISQLENFSRNEFLGIESLILFRNKMLFLKLNIFEFILFISE